MGCCGSLNKNNYEMPYEKIEEYNKLKKEIDEIITNNENPYRKDSNKLLELLNKTSVKISEYEEELDNLKNKKNIDKNIRGNYIKGLNSDIKELKDYYLNLDNLIKENDNDKVNDKVNDRDEDKDNDNKIKIINLKLNINEIKKEDIINEKVPLSNRVQTNSDILKNINIKNDVILTEQSDMSLNNTDNIYFKKYVRRNKRRNNLKQRFIPQADLFGFPKPEKFNFLTNNNGLVNKDEISTSEVTNDIINIIFVLQNGKKVGIQIKKNDKFLTAIEKLGEKEENLKDINNMILLDGEEDITDKVKNGENISSFGFDDYHFIQVKLIEQN